MMPNNFNLSPQRQFASTGRDFRVHTLNNQNRTASRFGKDHQNSIDDLNKQTHIEGHSFFSSRRVSRTRKASNPRAATQKSLSQAFYSFNKRNPTSEQKTNVQKFLDKVQTKLPQESVRAEILKAHHVNELNKKTRERLCQAQELGQGGFVGKSVVDRDCQEKDGKVLSEGPNIAAKTRVARDPQILSLMDSAKDALTQTAFSSTNY